MLWTSNQICILATIWTGVFCNYVCYSIIAPFFPQLARKKGLTAVEYSFVFGAYSLAQLTFSFIVGKYLSRIGAKFIVVAGLFLTGGATILFGALEQSPGGNVFLALSVAIRFVEGAGFAAYFTSVLAIIVETFPSDPGYFVGLTETVVTVGMIMGPPLGSFLYTVGGYATPFVAFGVTLIIAAVVAIFSIRINRTDPFDTFEVDSATITSAEYVQVLRLPAAIVAVLCVCFNVVADVFILITLSSHLEQFNLTKMQVGCIYLCLFLAYGLSSPVTGRLSDRFGHELLLQCLGSMVIVVSFLLMGPTVFLPLKAQLCYIVIALLLKGLGAGPLISCSYSSCLKAAKQYAGRSDDFRTYTLVSTIVAFSIPLGNLLGGFTAGVLYEYLGMSLACTLFAGVFSLLSLLCLAQHLVEKQSLINRTAKRGPRRSQNKRSRKSASDSELSPLCSNVFGSNSSSPEIGHLSKYNAI